MEFEKYMLDPCFIYFLNISGIRFHFVQNKVFIYTEFIFHSELGVGRSLSQVA